MFERILRFSIERKEIVIILTVVAAFIGFLSLKNLPIDAVPDITNNQVQINSFAPGYSPEQMEKQVTFPIEMALSGIPGLEGTRSLSRNSFSQVTAIFEDHVDIYFARQQIAERLTEARESIPHGVEPKMGPISTGLGEVYMWTVEWKEPIKYSTPGWQKDGSYLTPEGQRLRGEVELASYLRTVQDWIIRPQLKRIKGLAGVDSSGGFVRQYHVQPDPQQLLALGITFENIADAIEKNNVNIGAGFVESGGEAFIVKADGRISSIEEIESIVITTKEGAPIYIADVAEVGLGRELRSGSSSENGKEVVIGTAMMLVGENSRTVATSVDSKLKEVAKSLPPGVTVKPVLNRMKLIDATIRTVRDNLVEGAILVIVVLFLFLGDFRAACITALVIPLSMLFTAFGMVQSKISGNLMSLGAIDFGLIVDGAVIIVENCQRRLKEKRGSLGRMLSLSERLSEVKEATIEMVRPTVFGQAIIITVYIPLLTLNGVEGKMFHPMAATVIFALLFAFLLSITFVPAMCAIFVRGEGKENQMNWMEWLKSRYRQFIEDALEQPKKVLAVGFSCVLLSFFLFQGLGQEFIPTLDEQDIAVQVTRIPSTSLTQATEMQKQVELAINEFPEVEFVFSKTGTAEMASDPMPPDASDTLVMLRPKEEWPNPKLTKVELIDQLSERLDKLTGNQFEFTQPIEMRFNELIAGVKADLAVRVFGDDYALLTETADKIGHLLEEIDGACDVIVEPVDGLPTLEFIPDRVAISRFGLNIHQIFDLIEIAIGGKRAGDLYEGDRQFEVIVRLPESLRHDIALLENLPVPLPPSEEGAAPLYLPLREFGSLVLKEGLNQISREDGKRLMVVQSNVRGRDLGSFVDEAQRRIDKEVVIPAGYWISYGGQFQHLLSGKERLSYVLPVCFLLIFILLYSALHSLRYALLVFTGVPLALTGGIIALWLTGMPFSISAAVGCIAVSGISVLNGLVLVTAIKQINESGVNLKEAILQAGTIRLRPVLITALVASLGFLPMSLATGAGAEVQKPIAIVVIGGLVSSTLLTLAFLPLLTWVFRPKEKKN